MKNTAFFVMNAGGSYFSKVPGGFVQWVQHIGKANLFTSRSSAEYCREKYSGDHIVEMVIPA